MNVLVIDNYDSFTYNLVHMFGAGEGIEVRRNDRISLEEIENRQPNVIVLSPGPCTPDDAGICLSVVDRFSESIPIFGVCLGLQAIGQAFGGKVVRAPTLMHGKVSPIRHSGTGVFQNIDTTFQATRYHSLAVERHSLPAELDITATADDGSIMGLQHRTRPVHGVQFHPESIASEHGQAIVQNFLTLARDFNVNRAA